MVPSGSCPSRGPRAGVGRITHLIKRIGGAGWTLQLAASRCTRHVILRGRPPHQAPPQVCCHEGPARAAGFKAQESRSRFGSAHPTEAAEGTGSGGWGGGGAHCPLVTKSLRPAPHLPRVSKVRIGFNFFKNR